MKTLPVSQHIILSVFFLQKNSCKTGRRRIQKPKEEETKGEEGLRVRAQERKLGRRMVALW